MDHEILVVFQRKTRWKKLLMMSSRHLRIICHPLCFCLVTFWVFFHCSAMLFWSIMNNQPSKLMEYPFTRIFWILYWNWGVRDGLKKVICPKHSFLKMCAFPGLDRDKWSSNSTMIYQGLFVYSWSWNLNVNETMPMNLLGLDTLPISSLSGRSKLDSYSFYSMILLCHLDV